MSFRRSDGPADRAESERLLDAARAGTPPQPAADPLAHLLAAAAAPAGPGELAGEEQAVAAFRAARANPVPALAATPRPRHRFRVGAVLAGIAATATAGVAFAAVSLDRTPEPAPPPVPATTGSTGAGGPGTPAPSGGATPTGLPSSGAPSTTPAPSGSGKPARAGQFAGQCRAYLAKSEQQRATALQSAGYADLVTAAGGPDGVESYCLALVPEKSAKPTSEPKPEPRTKSAPARETAPAGPAASPPRPGKPSAAPGH